MSSTHMTASGRLLTVHAKNYNQILIPFVLPRMIVSLSTTGSRFDLSQLTWHAGDGDFVAEDPKFLYAIDSFFRLTSKKQIIHRCVQRNTRINLQRFSGARQYAIRVLIRVVKIIRVVTKNNTRISAT